MSNRSQGQFEKRLGASLPPLPGEVITSWLIRLSAAHGLMTLTFCKLVAGTKIEFNRDMDGAAGTSLAGLMAARTGLDAAGLLADHSLAGLEGTLFPQLNSQAATPWILPMGRVNARLPFMQFCPLCLDASIPYYRRAWRLSLSTTCPYHGVSLLHACTSCGAVVNPIKVDTLFRRARTPLCWRCRKELRRGQTAAVEEVDAALARYHEELLQGAPDPRVGRNTVLTSEYFQVLGLLCARLVRRRQRLMRWRESAAHAAGVVLPAPVQRHVTTSFDSIVNPAQRRAVLRTATWLLEAWPERFLKVARDADTRPSDLVMYFSRYPKWFIEPLQTLPNSAHRATSLSLKVVRAERRRQFILAHRTIWSVKRQHRLVAALCKAGFYAQGTDRKGILSSVRRTIATLRAEGSDYRRRATKQIGRDTPEWQELLRLATPFHKQNCRSAEQLQRGIRLLCNGTYLSAYDLGELLGRRHDVIKAKYLTVMVREGWLETRHGASSSGFRNNPQQAYRNL